MEPRESYECHVCAHKFSGRYGCVVAHTTKDGTAAVSWTCYPCQERRASGEHDPMVALAVQRAVVRVVREGRTTVARLMYWPSAGPKHRYGGTKAKVMLSSGAVISVLPECVTAVGQVQT